MPQRAQAHANKHAFVSTVAHPPTKRAFKRTEYADTWVGARARHGARARVYVQQKASVLHNARGLLAAAACRPLTQHLPP